MLADILICRNVNQFYTYALPESDTSLSVGDHIEVPFGKSLAVGCIWDIYDGKAPKNVKYCGDKLHKKPTIKKELRDLIDWLREYYHLTPHKAYQTVVSTIKKRDLSTLEAEIIKEVDEEKIPNDEQKHAIDTVLNKDDHSFLIHGVTSSGKTEVYMQIAKRIIETKKTVLMLLPEIALTPQMRRNFKKRFGNKVAVIHSGLNPKQREIEWNRIDSGDVDIAIGPRSAIFVPMQNIGLIILDEEHDASYKQENAPRYLTHCVAEFRRAYHQARLIYGSATPDIELYYQAIESGNPTLITLSKRATKNTLPSITIVDKRSKLDHGEHPLFSEALIQGIEKNLAEKNKTLILLNRRGFAPYIICDYCNHIHACPECQLSYTYHNDRYFRCHRCDRAEAVTHVCGKCNKRGLNFGGVGTQKVESELLKLFPGIKLYRLDRDTANSTKKLEETLEGFQKDGDILCGTQMIAKGHHFEDVTLVGVLGIDSALNLPDFRSCERSYQLVSQVAGRAGRGQKKGHVIIQTTQPDHYVIEHATTHNFNGFYEQEIDIARR